MTNEEAIDCLVDIKEYYAEDRDFSYYGDEYHGLTVKEKEALCMAISALNHSATDINAATKEPEIIHCRDCKHNSAPITAANALCDLFYGMTDQFGFCHMGERRDGDERREE